LIASLGEPMPSDEKDQTRKQVTFGPETLLPSIERDVSEGGSGHDNYFEPESHDAEKSGVDAANSLPVPGSTEDGETVAWA
jgi:hypothetical protein